MNYRIGLFGGPNTQLTSKAMGQFATILRGPRPLPTSLGHLDHLPDELVSHILYQLCDDDPGSLLTLRRVNRRAKAFVDMDLQCEAVLARFRVGLAEAAELRQLRADMEAVSEDLDAGTESVHAMLGEGTCRLLAVLLKVLPETEPVDEAPGELRSLRELRDRLRYWRRCCGLPDPPPPSGTRTTSSSSTMAGSACRA